MRIEQESQDFRGVENPSLGEASCGRRKLRAFGGWRLSSTRRVLLLARGFQPLAILPALLVLGLTLNAAAAPKTKSAPKADPNVFRLTLLHTNDIHGHLLPFDYVEVGRGPKEQPQRGGAARRATLIRRLKTEIKNPVLVIDSGDLFTRGPLATSYLGLADVAAQNAAGYDLMAVGNNEFKARDGFDQSDAAGAQAALQNVVAKSRFPWICANLTDKSGASIPGILPYVVKTISGVRVGFLGLTTPRSAAYPQTKGWVISDPVAAAREWIPKARAHCDVLIAVTHLGTPADMLLAAQTSGLDAIVGGDSHTFLYQPLLLSNSHGDPVPIVQDGEFGADLGRFDLRFARDGAGKAWHLAAYADKLLPVDATLAEAPDVAAAIRPYTAPLQAVIGQIGPIASTPAARLHQTTQIVMDALRADAGADLALNPEGAGFFNVFRHSAVTRYDVLAALPFNDHVVTATLTGAEVQGLLKAVPTTVVSGAISGLDPAKSYRVAFVDFLASSEYHLPAARLTDTGRDMRDSVITYLEKPAQTP